MPDPFLIEGPARISFSGGRTSAYMLWRILQAHGGQLPAEVRVVFANTGKERPETLAFVQACAEHWGVRVRWVEWRNDGTHYGTFEEVGSNSASRLGEPFDALIDHKQMPPNWQARFCTEFLKVRAMTAFMLAETGLEPPAFKEIIGLRADEGLRIFKMMARNEAETRACTAPLAKAGVTVRDVMAFWAEQPFDLGLKPWEGNCTLCFMKSRKLRKGLIRQDPAEAAWWINAEQRTGGFFDRRDRYAVLAQEVHNQHDLFAEPEPEPDEYDVECDLICGAE